MGHTGQPRGNASQSWAGRAVEKVDVAAGPPLLRPVTVTASPSIRFCLVLPSPPHPPLHHHRTKAQTLEARRGDADAATAAAAAAGVLRPTLTRSNRMAMRGVDFKWSVPPPLDFPPDWFASFLPNLWAQVRRLLPLHARHQRVSFPPLDSPTHAHCSLPFSLVLNNL
jgi:hypothetical protein